MKVPRVFLSMYGRASAAAGPAITFLVALLHGTKKKEPNHHQEKNRRDFGDFGRPRSFHGHVNGQNRVWWFGRTPINETTAAGSHPTGSVRRNGVAHSQTSRRAGLFGGTLWQVVDECRKCGKRVEPIRVRFDPLAIDPETRRPVQYSTWKPSTVCIGCRRLEATARLRRLVDGP